MVIMAEKVTHQEVSNMRHVLSLLRNQLKAGRVDGDYMLRQFDKIEDLIDRFTSMQIEQKSAGRFEALYNVSAMIGASLDIDKVLEHIMDAVIQLTGAERGFLMLRDDDGDLQVRIARNLDQQTLTSADFEYSRTIASHVLDTGEAVVTTNAAEDSRFAGQASIVSRALRSIMVAPLRARGRVIGIAYVENRIVAGLFGEEDLATLETLMAQASVAVDNAMLFNATDDELSRRLDELQQLRRVDLQLNETLDPDTAMQVALSWAVRLSGAERGTIAFLEGRPSHLVNQHHYPAESETATSAFLDEQIPSSMAMLETHTAQVVNEGDSAYVQMLLPIIRDKDAIGVVMLEAPAETGFTDEQREIAERVVARSVVSIENARLYKRAQDADRAKSEFVGIVAHDLKAPMTSIGGYADLMLMMQKDMDDRQREFLERITGTVKRMEMLVSDLADISRIESGQFFMNEVRTPVSEVVQAIRDTIMPQVDKRQHTFVEKVDDDLPDMYTDYYRLVQVLTNLLSNAYKYTPDGGTITLHVTRDGDSVRYAVQDTGIGLPPEAVAKLGTKFWRAEDDYTRSQPGTGLGFAITASLVEQMGSQIEIDSEVGVGSIFSFSVALATDQGETE
jgi:signal transduction histidine kinase